MMYWDEKGYGVLFYLFALLFPLVTAKEQECS